MRIGAGTVRCMRADRAVRRRGCLEKEKVIPQSKRAPVARRVSFFASAFKFAAKTSKLPETANIPPTAACIYGRVPESRIYTICFVINLLFIRTVKKTRSALTRNGFLFRESSNYFLSASSTATATATVAPTIGLLPIPISPIISTCAGTEEEPAN